MLSEYRQRFGEFHTDLYREDFLFRRGQKSKRETAYILSEYRDLVTPTKIEELRAALSDVSAYREAEASSVRRLIEFAVEGNLSANVEELSEEIEQYESSARIDWEEQKISLEATSSLLSNEPDTARRREIYARRSELIRGINDLRSERIERIRDGILGQGYPNPLVMRTELRGVDFEKLAETAGKLLSKTERNYDSAMASLLAREANVSIRDATEADLPHLLQFPHFDHLFSREQMRSVYHELFRGLGFNTERQSNLEIDSIARPRKQPQAFCSPIQIPDEIKLVYTASGGQVNYRNLLCESGHAQNYAWTSRNLYPEFRISGIFTGPGAVQVAWGTLLENLMLDERWLISAFGFAESAKFRHTLAAINIMTLRRQAALLQYEVEFHAGRLPGSSGKRFTELMTDAVRVRYDETEHLRDLDHAFRSADILRACAFESQMREYLKTKFGLYWWASPKAGEMLIDLWNMGQRHSVEELASMIGLGELDFDWLVSELQTQLSE